MKKIKNMNITNMKTAFSSFEKKHHIQEDFDANPDVLRESIDALTDLSNASNILYDLFCYGFMAGYKQANADNKANFKKHTYSDEHRQIIELIYRLPITGGYAQDLYYSVIKRMFKDDVMEHFVPSRLSKAIANAFDIIESNSNATIQ